MDVTNIIVSKASDGALFPVVHIDVWDDFPEFGVPIGSEFHTATLFYLSRCIDHVILSDFAMIMSENEVAEPTYVFDTYTGEVSIDLEPDWGKNFGYASIINILSECDTRVERFRLVGANDGNNFQYVNPNHGLYVEGREQLTDGDGGRHIVQDSEFVGMGSNAYQSVLLQNAEVVVQSSVFRDGSRGVVDICCDGLDFTVTDSLFYNLQDTGVAIFGVGGCVADVSHNLMLNSSGIYVESEGVNPYTHVPEAPCKLSLEHNEIVQRADAGFAGIEVWNWGGNIDWGELTIKSNKIHGEGSWLWGPIYTYNAHNAEITSNIITGSGLAAMYIGVLWEWGAADQGILMLGNNVENFLVYEEFGTAQIWLGPYTSQCVVIGGNSKTNVFDETDDPATPWYDGNNILRGVR
jgi:hypothetical protein